MRVLLSSLLVCLGFSDGSLAAGADEKSPELVRLPGGGELKKPVRAGAPRERLLPGGGLFISFDANGDGVVVEDEIEAGIARAFDEADADGNGVLTALEQQAWARDLPTRDETLANPVRFDPNLDRRVSPEEFADVILGLARDYSEDGSVTVVISALRAPDPDREERQQAERRRAASANGDGRPRGS